MLRRQDGSSAVCLDRHAPFGTPRERLFVIRARSPTSPSGGKWKKGCGSRSSSSYLLESFPDLILVIDLERRYSFVSSRIRDLLGVLLRSWWARKSKTPSRTSRRSFCLSIRMSSGAKKFGFCEFGALHRDGSWRTMRAYASPLFDDGEKLSGVIMSVRDVTVERKLEQQIIQSERLAAMGQMIGGFAHELNNPLTTIMGVSELLTGWRSGRVSPQASGDAAPAVPPRG